MKLEGIVYFIGLMLGLWMMTSFWRIAWFPSVIGLVFVAMGSIGYAMMLANLYQNCEHMRRKK